MNSRLFVQSDCFQVLKKAEGEAWLSCKIPGKPTLYGSLKCVAVGSDGVPEITASEGFLVKEVTKKSILVSCPEENASSKFVAPYTTFSRVHHKSITCLDISSGGGLGVSTSTDGTMKIWQTNNGEPRRILEGHVYDVNCCRFFPSGLVVLSGGMDAQVKIWSAEDGSCPVTLKGHKGGEREIGTEGKLLLLAREDGKLQGASLQSRQHVFIYAGSDAMNCCAFLSSVHVLAGCQDGNIYRLDLRNPSTPVNTVHLSGAPVLSLVPFREGYAVSQGDGSCFIIQQDMDHIIELVGADCDPIYKVACSEKLVYTCCRDGIIRKYQLSDL